MGTTTPNISIYVPAAGETNYDQAFLAGMLNVDGHDHTGGPDNGVQLGAASIANASITNAKLANPSVTIDGTLITLGDVDVNPVWPSRCKFSAYLSANQVAATGDGTGFTIPFNTVLYNVGGGLNTGTGIFTAPVTGKYLFNVEVASTNYTAAHNYGIISLITTARQYNSNVLNYGALRANNGSNQVTLNSTFIADMTAGNTAFVSIAVSNSTKTIDVNTTGGGAPLTIFQGYLLG